jgi:hypothetical protein
LDDLLRLLQAPSPLKAYEVSRNANRSMVNTPEIIEPVERGESDATLFRTAAE